MLIEDQYQSFTISSNRVKNKEEESLFSFGKNLESSRKYTKGDPEKQNKKLVAI